MSFAVRPPAPEGKPDDAIPKAQDEVNPKSLARAVEGV
jgi:hypothetical protein